MILEKDYQALRGTEGIDWVPDLDGKRVIAGMRIAYAATDGRSSGLRIGKVVEIVAARLSFYRWDKEKEYPNKVPCKLRVEVQESSGYGTPSKPVLIEAGFKRFVRL